mmetsp:Transcript_37146/g.43210  ORF Transcript_37146/g.43210 Transcript_37146/m.43210 type:complete len:575 (+) Transcript_37146:103-1827(+)|eukprot:CAMPEP_0194392656 /NCGR_PEP_ID=MMETSP0174-20130528/122853_1 /TAXON_ID=216777 /ORGANISM="Proboscia alata, Strain PI-D3" /LENGTH=574 /DNA_ID=CAMNT_0039188245 /DNA_START=120 /DNA_END=1844 /DNA_ORIENTATION=+
MTLLRSRLCHPTEFFLSLVTLSVTIIPRPGQSLQYQFVRQTRPFISPLHATVSSTSVDEELMRTKAMERRGSSSTHSHLSLLPGMVSSNGSEISGDMLEADIHAAIKRGGFLLDQDENDDELWPEDLDEWSINENNIHGVEPLIPDAELKLQMNAVRKKTKSNESNHVDSKLFSAYEDDDVIKSVAALCDKEILKRKRKSKKAHVMTSSTVQALTQPSLKLEEESSLPTITGAKRKMEKVKEMQSIEGISQRKGQLSEAEQAKRITPQEEIRLSRLIQEGTKLHKIKSEHEEKIGYKISHNEWANMAGLSSNELQGLIRNHLEAKSQLVMANIGLIHAVIKNTPGYNRENGVPKDDLVQEGSLGLIRAAELFDPDLGFRFSTYATTWIKGILGNNKLDMNIVIPLRERGLWRKVEKAKELFTDRNGRSGSVEEIASLAKVKVKDVERVLEKMPKLRNVASLDQRFKKATNSGTAEGGGMSLHESKALMEHNEQESIQMREDVIKFLENNLGKREAQLMKFRYGLEDGKSRSLNQCAKAMGISLSTARKIGLGCLEKLREAEDGESLREYFTTVA